MAKNDTVLIDGIIEARQAEGYPSKDKGEIFEYFSLEQILKSLDLSQDEIESGWIDGRDDGGIDGIYIEINGHLLTDPEVFPWPKRNAEVTLYVVTCKHHDTFQQAPLDSLVASISEIFDFSIDENSLKGAYSAELLSARKLIHLCYKRTAMSMTSMNVKFFYASRGDTSKIGDSILSRSDQIKSMMSAFFHSSSAEFLFLGSSELVEMHRKVKNFKLELPFIECMSQGVSYVVLARLKDYKKFVTDESGSLRRYLFDANVRDFLGTNRVNEDIASSLANKDSVDFWWLNNGVTILATSAKAIGKTLHLEDVQIVNGLQTTETLFKFFSTGGDDKERALLVKVINSENAMTRDRIIRATNNQSLVQLTSLHATDKIQRDIEEILEKHGWFYERRTNYYRNEGKPSNNIITPIYVATGAASLLLKNPARAVKLKSKFMRNQQSYDKVFSKNMSLEVWPKIVSIQKIVDAFLLDLKSSEGGKHYFLMWRSYISFFVVSRLLGTFSYLNNDLCSIDIKSITPELLQEILEDINTCRTSSKKENKKFDFLSSFGNPTFTRYCCAEFEKKYKIKGKEVVCRQEISMKPTESTMENIQWFVNRENPLELSEDFLESVNMLLPSQPWEKGVHKKIALKLGCKKSLVQAAIDELVRLKKRYKQVDGIVYDMDGRIINT